MPIYPWGPAGHTSHTPQSANDHSSSGHARTMDKFFLPKKGSLVIFLTKKVKYENDKKCMEAKTNEAFGI